MARPCAYNLPTYRICVTMQRKMDFLFGKMKPGMHEKHFEWFKKQVIIFLLHLLHFDFWFIFFLLIRLIHIFPEFFKLCNCLSNKYQINLLALG